jgi:hypothetical protein
MTTAVILLSVALVVLVALYVLTTVQFRKALEHSLQITDSVHFRQLAMLNKTLDRLMAHNFQEFKAFSSVDQSPEGYVEEQTQASPSSEQATAVFESFELPPRDAPLIHGERWSPPEEQGIDPSEEGVEIENR